MKKYSNVDLVRLCGTDTVNRVHVNKCPNLWLLTFLNDYFENNNPFVATYLRTRDDEPLVNSLDIQVSPLTPDEVKSFFSSLTKEFPLIRGFANADDAFELIKDRYAQYGSELDSYLSRLTSILESEQQSVSDSSVDVQSTSE